MLSWLEQHLLPCAWKSLLGIDCPLCGFQRSFLALLRGDLLCSIEFYPPLVPMLLLVSVFSIYLLRRQWISKKWMANYTWIVLGIVLINYLVRIFQLIYHHGTNQPGPV